MMTQKQQARIGGRLRTLREERNLSQESLSARLGFNDRQTLAAIEAGERRIAPDELVRAAHVLGVDVDTFLDPYRLVGEGSFSFRAKDVDPETLSKFQEQAGRWIATYRELGMQVGCEPRRLGHKLELTERSSFEDAAASADLLRERWDLGNVPADRLEDAVHRELGVLVLYVDAPVGISGAASHLPGQHTIVVNRREPAGRRSFDLAHELFHLLTWDAMPPKRIEPQEVKRTKGNRVELMAENFAAALLMPAEIVARGWSTRGDEDVSVWLARTAAELRISTQALQWRLVNLGLLSRAAAAALPPVPRSSRVSVDQAPPLFSRPFVQRVADAVNDGRLSLRRAATLLGVTVLQFAQVCAAHQHPLSYDLPG
ncbi:MAG TPA: XRE family transcriptional regulator [Longimicrobium sp.]|jgi:Zn-dependent peptidase ImmA (M78 family)/DNA-binding XRE family transcriptional regulator|uniref:helix-turn-helix domain-containing protein n=1 Tax=Longimicrobium sp. TaxID=2029185 RepID=UPI002ED9BC59